MCRHQGGTGGCRCKLRLIDSRRKVSDGGEQSHLVEPSHPHQRLVLLGIGAAPRGLPNDDFGLVQPDHALGQRVIIGIPHAADGGRSAHLRLSGGVAQRNVLRPVVRVDHQPRAPGAIVHCLLQRIQD
jgi:hypothetical protein